MLGSNPVSTPMPSGLTLTKVATDLMQDPFMLRYMVGALQYATLLVYG